MVPRTGDGEMLYRKKQKSCDKKKKSENSKLLYQLKKEKTKSMQHTLRGKGLWYKSYSGGRWTWPTPLKSPESKSKSPSPTRRSRVGLGDLDLDDLSGVGQVHLPPL